MSSEVCAPLARWRIVPLRTPRVLRRCARCDVVRPFQSSDRFRINANGRKLDVWLVYRCGHSGISWNRTVLERRTPEEIGELLPRYESNDADLAWRHAFDTGGLDVESEVPVRVERTGIVSGRIVLEVPWPVPLRLDRLLAAQLGISRGGLADRVDRRALRRPVRDGMTVVIRD